MASFLSRSRGLGFGLLLVVLNTACSQIPLSTIRALDKIDPETTPAKALRVMVDLPEFAHPQPGGITIDLRETGAPEGLELHLVPVLGEQKRERAKRGGNLFVYKIKPADIALFNQLRATKDDDNDVQLNANGNFCRTTPQLPERVIVSLYLKTAELPDYVLLVNKVDLIDEIGPKELAVEFPVCG